MVDGWSADYPTIRLPFPRETSQINFSKVQPGLKRSGIGARLAHRTSERIGFRRTIYLWPTEMEITKYTG
ncbi:hypothetical protein VTN49DRAFT_27 [Thermomyces lanuginosus]|uniref:uncharacterized protein n=1 Tax=Thermomyces lanuginosus TaxID=5541 RepID=UPI003742803E